MAETVRVVALARIFYELARKIDQGLDRLKDFPNERNNRVYFRARKILQTIKYSARARHTREMFGLTFLEDQRRVGAAKAKTVRHGRADAGTVDTFSHQRHILHSRVCIIDVD